MRLKISDELRDMITEGDIVVVHPTNFDYSKRIGDPFRAVVIWKEFRGQPLILKCEDLASGEYNPRWSSYRDITHIVGHIDIVGLITREVNQYE